MKPVQSQRQVSVVVGVAAQGLHPQTQSNMPTAQAVVHFILFIPKANLTHPLNLYDLPLWGEVVGSKTHPHSSAFISPPVVIYRHFISRAAEVGSYYSPTAVKVETIKASKSPKTKTLSNNHEALSFIPTTLIHLSFFHPFSTFDMPFFTPVPFKESIKNQISKYTIQMLWVFFPGENQY